MFCFVWGGGVCAQEMGLQEAIETARSQSVQAKQARHTFISAYWAYRSYKASLLPSLSVYGNLMNFNRSKTLLQSYEDGSLHYVGTNNLQNSLGIQLSQNITLTGGRISLYSDLARVDQFGANKNLTWYSQPITISYSQPIFSYNSFKWSKQIEPKSYEASKRKYLESMENVTVSAVSAYYAFLHTRLNYDISKENYANTRQMLAVARERMALGSVSREECLHLELRMLNDSISVNENLVRLRESQMVLNSLLGLDETTEIIPVLEDNLPSIILDYDFVMDKVMANASFNLENEISELNAQSEVDQAKANRGITMSLNARFGLSQTGKKFGEAYTNPLDQEVVGITFSIPVFDWGMGKGKVQKAKAAEEVVKAQVRQKEIDHRSTIFTAVGEFNNQRQQCSVSKRAMEIAQERYSIVMEKFRNGTATVTELNTARQENDSSRQQFITDIRNFWTSYYTLRKYTLYDFIKDENLEVDEKEMIEN
ncbi:MAG: TolC family protein [Bacteroidales bacterium]|nr:TolC family protein [Bacteroidales bacterium]